MEDREITLEAKARGDGVTPHVRQDRSEEGSAIQEESKGCD